MTLGTSHVDFEEALGDPQGWFAEPQDVVAHPELTPEQKLAILRRWERNALRSSASGSAAMVGGADTVLGVLERALQAAAALKQGG